MPKTSDERKSKRATINLWGELNIPGIGIPKGKTGKKLMEKIDSKAKIKGDFFGARRDWQKKYNDRVEAAEKKKK